MAVDLKKIKTEVLTNNIYVYTINNKRVNSNQV